VKKASTGLVLVLAICLVLPIVACGGDDQGGEGTSAAGRVEITFWHSSVRARPGVSPRQGPETLRGDGWRPYGRFRCLDAFEAFWHDARASLEEGLALASGGTMCNNTHINSGLRTSGTRRLPGRGRRRVREGTSLLHPMRRRQVCNDPIRRTR